MLVLLGSVVFFPAMVLYIWGQATLGREFAVSTYSGADLYTGHRLVMHGPFRWTRHPMYLAVIVGAFGALLIFQTWAMAIFVPMSFVVVLRAGREEELLEREFGEEWRAYTQQVPKWIPRWFGGGL